MAKKQTTVDEQLKAAIRATGWTSYRLWKESGVSIPVIDRYLTGERDIRMATAVKLCEALNLELVSRK